MLLIPFGQATERIFELTNKTGDEQVVIEVEKDAQFKGIALLSQLGGGTVSLEIRMRQGAQAEIYGLVIGQGNEQGGLKIIMNHLEPATRGNVIVKAVLDGEARFTFDGLIKIAPEAQKTQSYLREDVLLLSKDARTVGQPRLEIAANDVKASHGSTIGRIDENQLFYLASRGLDVDQGKKLIVDGFVWTILEQITDGQIRRKINNTLLLSLRAEPAASAGVAKQSQN